MTLAASPPWESRGAGLKDSSLSPVSFSLAALLGGTAVWGAWAEISDHKVSLMRSSGP